MPKGDETTPRGHGILAGDADVIIRLSPDADTGIVWAKLTKNRNGPSGAAFGFKIDSQELAEDEDGDPITAPVADECSDGDTAGRAEKLSPAQRTARSHLADLIAAGGKPLPYGPSFPHGLLGVTEAEWRHTCDSRRLSTADNPKDRAGVFRRAYRDLLAKRAVAARDGLVWLTTPSDQTP